MTEQVAGDPGETTNEPSDTTQTPDPIATLLAEIKDESGRQKYSDVETAIKALKASQEYIPQIKSELETLREKAELTSDFKTVQELLMTEPTDNTDPTQPAENTTQQEPTSTQEPQPQPTEQSLKEQFEAFLAEKSAEEASTKNLNTVKEKVQSLFGEKTEEAYKEKAEELGVSTDFLDEMAKKSPAAVLAYFQSTKPPQSAPSTVNTAGVQPTKAEVPYVLGGATRSDVQSAWENCHPDNFGGGIKL